MEKHECTQFYLKTDAFFLRFGLLVNLWVGFGSFRSTPRKFICEHLNRITARGMEYHFLVSKAKLSPIVFSGYAVSYYILYSLVDFISVCSALFTILPHIETGKVI